MHFEKVFKLEPQRHIALAEIGWIYCQKEEYEKAIDYILKAIESTDQEVAEYYYRLGRVYWSMGGSLVDLKKGKGELAILTCSNNMRE